MCGDLQAQPLDQVAGGELADIAAGIGIAELQRQPAGGLQIGAVVRAAQRLLQHRRALLQRLGGLEQRADLDVLLDAEQPRQPERGEQRVAGLGFGDQEAHRDGTVHVLDDLRHRHHQPRGRGLLGDQRAEIDRHGLHRIQRGVDRGEQGAAVRRDPPADRRCPGAGAPRCGSAPRSAACGCAPAPGRATPGRRGRRTAPASRRPRPAAMASRNSGSSGAGEVSAIVAVADQRLREGGDLGRVGRIGTQRESARPRRRCASRDAFGQRVGGRQRRRAGRAAGRAAGASFPAAGAACPTSRYRCGRRCRSRPRWRG